jgi:hypothetical protein
MPQCETTAPALLDREGVSVRCLLYTPASGDAASGNAAPGEQAKETAQ